MLFARSFLAVAAITLTLLSAGAATADSSTGATPAVQETPAPILQFGVERGRMTVPVSVDGRGPFAFVIDTGAERSVVSRELATSLGLVAGRRARLFDFVGASAVETVKVPALSVSTLDSTAMEAPSLAMANLGAPGMLGIDALRGHKVAIDFNRKQMKVTPASRHASGEIVVKAEMRVGQLIVTQASFEGQPIAVIIDTGTWVSVGNRAMLALAQRPPRFLGPISVTSVTGRSFNTDYVAVNDLKIGGVHFNNVGLSFADVAPFERFGLRDTPALILGMSSLKLFQRVEIDFANREIAFTLPRPPISFHSACRAFSNCNIVF